MLFYAIYILIYKQEVRRKMLIYKITRILDDGTDGKIYVGQTVNTLRDKISQYKKDIKKLQNKTISGRPIIRSLLKYGIENFRWEIIEDNISDGNILDEREIYWIKELNSNNRKIGYNISPGGDLSMRGVKLEGKRLEQVRAAVALGTQIAADMMRGKPLTGIRLETTLKNVQKAQKKSAEVRLGRPDLKRRVKLTETQIEEIRQDTRTCIEVGNCYGISAITVSRIRSRRRYFKGV
jgi:group I intron endonuclease